MSTTEEMIKKMYDSQLKSQKEQLDTDYAQAVLDLDAQHQKNAQATDTNLTRTAVEAQKAAVNNAELHNAYGLSSGARAQARLAQENQLQADMTAIRTAQQSADADIERQRSLMAQEYTSAIRQAQAENDLAKAQALYESAKEAESRLLARQEAAAKLMAEAGDYSRLGALYGLTEQEIAALAGVTTKSDDTPKESTVVAENMDNTSDASHTPATPWGNPFSQYKSSRTEAAKNIIKEAMGSQSIHKEDAELRLDQNSIDALGFGPISEVELNRLVEAGIVEEYVEDGYLRFRKKLINPRVNAAGSALKLPWE